MKLPPINPAVNPPTNAAAIIPSAAFAKDLLAAIAGLRAFALSLSMKADRADDLVQETVLKAWKYHGSFEAGTNIKAWLYTILRNEFYSQLRKSKREVEDIDGIHAGRVGMDGSQLSHLDMMDMQVALAKLPDDQREAVILVGASGFSYEEAAEICQVAVGTVKSRVSRARLRLNEILGIEESDALRQIKRGHGGKVQSAA
jgi:RNA polymerase sigma-70 factor, ECF subfamily